MHGQVLDVQLGKTKPTAQHQLWEPACMDDWLGVGYWLPASRN